ncbi:hypothetical protein ACS0TY_035461 [Phlomoides rotata]
MGGMDIIHGKKLSRDEQRVVVITQLINICVGIIGMMNIFISQFFFEDLESADIIHHPIRYSLISRVPKQIKNLHNVVGISDVECLNQLRMTRDVFSRLCFVLQNSGGLKASRNTSVGEQDCEVKIHEIRSNSKQILPPSVKCHYKVAQDFVCKAKPN